MRKVSLLLVLAAVVLTILLTPHTASACRRCGFKLDCEIYPDCEIIPVCKGTEFPTRGYVGCEAGGSSCDTWGEQCEWADNLLQPEEDDLLAFLMGHNLSSAMPEEQCREPFAL